MPKIADCDRCSLYAHNPHLVCTVHPEGVETNKCLDFKLNPNAEIEKQWSPRGYSWYGNELIANKPSRYSQLEQMQILDNHPFFTGVCPQCSHKFNREERTIHFDCPNCGWVDDSV